MMQGVKVNHDGDFRSLGSSGVFDALSGSRYGSNVDLTGTSKPRPLSKALQPKTVNVKVKDKQQRSSSSSSYRQPVVALPPRDPLTKGSTESTPGRHSHGYTKRSTGNYGDQALSNQAIGNQLHTYHQSFGTQILASRPKNYHDVTNGSNSIQNQQPGRRSNRLVDLGNSVDLLTFTPGTAQAHSQTLWIEKTKKGGGGEQPLTGKTERDNRTWQNDVVGGYRSVPLSNTTNRRNSVSDPHQRSNSFGQNPYRSRSSAVILAKPRCTRYGSLCDLSKESVATQDEDEDQQACRGVDSYGLLLRTSGLRRTGTNPGSNDVFESSDSRLQRRGSYISISGNGDITGNAWNREHHEVPQPTTSGLPVGRSLDTQMVMERMDRGMKIEKNPELFTVRDSDHHKNSGRSPPMVRNRRSSFDQTWFRQENNPKGNSTLGVSSKVYDPSTSPASPVPQAQHPEERPETMQTPFRERSQSASLNRVRVSSGDLGNRPDQAGSTVLALRSSRYPSAKITDSERSDLVVNPSGCVVPSPWSTKPAPSISGDTEDTQSWDFTMSNTPPPMEETPLEPQLLEKPPVLSRCFRGDVSSIPFDYSSSLKVGEVELGEFSSNPNSPLTSESTGNRTESFRSTLQLRPEVTDYTTKQNHITTSSSCDVRREDGYHTISDLPASQRNYQDWSESRTSSTGDGGTENSPSARPMSSTSWQNTRRNSLPTAVLERKDFTTRGKGGNYESVFSKGDWINAARMTWKNPLASSRESLAREKPAGGRDYLPSNWRTQAYNQISSANSSANPPMSEPPVEKIEQLQRCAVVNTMHDTMHRISDNSYKGSDANLYDSNSRESSNAIVPEYSSNESLLSCTRELETMTGMDTVELLRSEEDKDSVSGNRCLVKRPGFVQGNWKALVETKGMESHVGPVKQVDSESHPDWKTPDAKEISCTGVESKREVEFDSIRSDLQGRAPEFNSSGYAANRTPHSSEQRHPPRIDLPEAPNTCNSVCRVESGTAPNPVTTRESTKSRQIDWKEWYYSGLERTTDPDQSSEDRSSCTAQVSDHESGYQSSGPTLDERPLNKLNSEEVKSVQTVWTTPYDSVKIEKDVCDSDTETRGRFPSEKEFPFPAKTSDETPACEKLRFHQDSNVEDRFELGGKETERAAPVEHTGVEIGGTKELEIHIRGGLLGVGFSIEGGLGSTTGDRPITVKRIFTGGDHLRDKLKPGDEILRVNDRDFSTMTHYDAWNYLKTIPEGPALLLVHTTD